MNFEITKILLNKDLSESSIKKYIGRLMKIINSLNINKLDEFDDYNFIKKYLDANITNLNTYISYLNAIINITSNYNYVELRKKKYRQNELIKGDNLIDDEKFIKYEDLKNIVNFDINDNLTKYQDNMLLYFAIYHPLRLDYSNIKINYYRDKIDTSNYLIYRSKYIELHLNDYKTKKIYGEFINKFDTKTLKIVKKYIELYKKEHGIKPVKLFDFVSTEMYSRKLQKLLLNQTGKKLTNNDIRSSYETSFIKSDVYRTLSNNDKEKHSNKILHSHSTALNSYYKI